jgi:hypothetical protein
MNLDIIIAPFVYFIQYFCFLNFISMLTSFLSSRLKQFLSLIIFFTVLNNADADWKVVNAGINENLLSVSSYDINGLIVGEKNIYITTTGGKTSPDWSLYPPTGSDANVFKQSKFYSSSEIYGNGIVYICGEDTINHTAVIFSIKFGDKSLKLEYTGTASSKLNSIVYTYSTVYAVGNNGLLIQRSTPESLQSDQSYHIVATNTIKDLYQIIDANTFYYIAGDEVLISMNISYAVMNTQVCPGKKFLSIALSSYGSFLIAVTATEVYNVNQNLTYSRDISYDAPGLSPTSICLSDYGEYIASKKGIYFQKSNTTYFEYQPSSLDANLNFLRFEDNLYSAFGVGQNGLIIYNTNSDNGGLTKPFARISIQGGCTNDYITYTGQPGGASNIEWYANDVYKSSSATWFAQFATPGKYDIKFISSNASYSDTVYQSIYIADKPLFNLPTSVSDNILCKSEQTVISIENSQDGYQYQLRKPTENTIYGTVNSTGGTVNMLTNYINTSDTFTLRAISPQSGCLANFTNTIAIKVEHTKARFTPSEINVSPNTPVTLNNNSSESLFAKWTIVNGANTTYSTSFSTQANFATSGATSIKLVATSVNNCSDSITAPGPLVIAEPPNNECWMMHFDPFTKNPPQAVTTDIKECSDGFLITGQYFKQDFPSHVGASYKGHPFGGGFLAKYSRAGILKWVSYTIDTTNFNEYYYRGVTFNSVAVAPNGNIYAIGNISGNQYIFDSSGDSIKVLSNIASTGVGSLIVCYSPDGKLIWTKHFSQVPNQLIADNDGNLIMSGTYGNDMAGRSFRFGIGNDITSLPVAASSVFTANSVSEFNGEYILKLDPNGEYLWYTLLSSILDITSPLSVDENNNILFTSSCQGTCGLFSSNLTQVKKLDAFDFYNNTNKIFGFAAKYSPDGMLMWTTKMEDVTYSAEASFGNTITINNNIYITGTTYSTASYRITQPDNSFVTITSGPSFLLKLDENGFYQWLSSAKSAFISTAKVNDTITLLTQIGTSSGDNVISASGTLFPYSFNNTFAFINYDLNGNVLSMQPLSTTNSHNPYLNLSATRFFYCSANNSIYLNENISVLPPYQILDEILTETNNYFIYKISNDYCNSVPPITTGTKNNVDQNTSGLSVYPNPVNETSVIFMGKEGVTKTISVMDVTGKVVATGHTDDISYSIDALLSRNIAGLYIIQVICNNEISTSRVIKLY